MSYNCINPNVMCRILIKIISWAQQSIINKKTISNIQVMWFSLHKNSKNSAFKNVLNGKYSVIQSPNVAQDLFYSTSVELYTPLVG